MSLTTEELAAMERLHRANRDGTVSSAHDLRIASRIALREHDDDDDEPITEAWLRSIGFAEKDARYGPKSLTLMGVNTWKGIDTGDWQFRYSTDPFEFVCLNRHRSFETRGDVRQLCQALGIELKG